MSLALRADAFGPGVTDTERAALRSIAEDIKALSSQVRQLRGPTGGSALSPDREGSLVEWWRLVERFGRAVLGRGIVLRGEIADLSVSAEQSHALAVAVLALFRHVSVEGETPPAAVTVRAVTITDGVEVHVAALDTNEGAFSLPTAGPWRDYAQHIVRRVSIELQERDGVVRLRVAR